MPFDAIMGVGRTPQITNDLITNPYSLSTNDVSQVAMLSDGAEICSISSRTGNIKDMINPNFDSSATFAYTITSSELTPDANNNIYIIFDFGKIIFFKSFEYKYQYTIVSGGGGGTYNPDGDTTLISDDGINWTSTGIKHSTGNFEGSLNYVKFRFLKLRAGFKPNVGATGYQRLMKINYTRFIMDNFQR